MVYNTIVSPLSVRILQLRTAATEMRRLDREITKEYRLAQERVPDIVAIESDPLKHLRTEDGDAQRAASRVAQYWKKRKHYFGDERWLLPMTQTEGTGALSPQDIEVLRSGYLVMVTLHSGQQVVLIDPSRLHGRDPGESRERCLFYLCTNEVKERSSRFGLEVIFLLTAYGFASERHTEMIDVIYGSMPTKVRHMTVVQSNEQGRQELLDFLSFRLEKTFTMFTPTTVSVVHATSRRVVIDALAQRGIHQRYLPKQLGGDYDYSQLHEWVQTRLFVESAMGAALPPRNAVPLSFRRQFKRSHSATLKKQSSSPLNHKLRALGPPNCITSILWNGIEHKRKEFQSKKKTRKIKRQNLVLCPPLDFVDTAREAAEDTNECLRDIINSALQATSSPNFPM